MTEPDLKTAKDEAVKAAGGVTRLSEKLRITRSAVSQWPKVPAERVLDVERASGMPRHLIRPDLYPAPSEQVA